MIIVVKKFSKSIFKNCGLLQYTFLILFVKSILFSVFIKNQHEIQSGSIHVLYTLSGFSIHSFLYYAGFIILSLCPMLLLKNYVQAVSVILFNIFISAIFLIDIWYVRAFNMVPSIHLIQMGDDLFTSLEGARSLVRAKDFILALDILPLILLSILRRDKILIKPVSIISFVTLAALSVMLIIGAAYIQCMSKDKPGSYEMLYRSNTLYAANEISPLGYLYYSTYKYFTEGNIIPLSNNDKYRIKNWYERKIEALPYNELYALFKGMNLLVIQVESLEKFVINREIDGQQITPSINRLLKNSIYFTNIYEQVKGGNSADAELLANTSIYPVHIGTTFIAYHDRSFNSLPKILYNMGYHTSAIKPDKGSMWNWKAALESMGFKKCIDSSSFNIDERIGMGISDRSFLRQAVPLIIQEKQPFYVFMVTLSSHVPFKLPGEHRNLLLASGLESSRMGDYLQCINYTDRQLGIFIDELEQNGLLDNTVIVIYGDHEGVHKYFQSDVVSMDKAQDWFLYNNKQLPLIIYRKNLQSMEINTIGGQIDIMPTISYIMGVEEKDYINTAMGRNLFNTNKSFAVLRDKSLIAGFIDGNNEADVLDGPDIADMIIRSDYFVSQ